MCDVGTEKTESRKPMIKQKRMSRVRGDQEGLPKIDIGPGAAGITESGVRSGVTTGINVIVIGHFDGLVYRMIPEGEGWWLGGVIRVTDTCRGRDRTG